MVGYIKRQYIPSKIKSFFNLIKVEEFDLGYIFKIPECANEKKQQKVITKLIQKINKLDVNVIVFSKELKKEEEICINLLEQKKLEDTKDKELDIAILQGKKIMEYIEPQIFEYILKKQGTESKKEDIYILVKKQEKWDMEYLNVFLQNFKTVNIVTNDLDKFKTYQENLYETESILISVSNNKKKALKNANYILNYNLTENEIKKYKMNRNAVVVNNKYNVNFLDKGFNGILINNIEVEIADEVLEKYEEVLKNDEFDIIKIYEGYICTELKNALIINKNSYDFRVNSKVITEYIQNADLKVKLLIGINGKIEEKELKNVFKMT